MELLLYILQAFLYMFEDIRFVFSNEFRKKKKAYRKRTGKSHMFLDIIAWIFGPTIFFALAAIIFLN